MALVNEHFLKLPGSYLFSDIAKKVNTFKITHPKQDIIRLGIGDVTQPLPKACIEAMHKAVEELASKDTFRGYGPEQGYDFLIEAIIKNDFAPRGIHFSPSEIFVNDGAKSDTGNIGEYVDSRYPADLCFCFGLADGFSYSDYSTPGNVFCNDYVSHLSGKV